MGGLRWPRLRATSRRAGKGGDWEGVCVLPFRDVYARTDVASEITIRVESWHTVVENPAILSIFSPQPVMHLKRLSAVKCFAVGLQTAETFNLGFGDGEAKLKGSELASRLRKQRPSFLAQACFQNEAGIRYWCTSGCIHRNRQPSCTERPHLRILRRSTMDWACAYQ